MSVRMREQKLYSMLRSLVEQRMRPEDFCAQFERVFNFEIDRSMIPQSKLAALEELFDDVVYYSPFPKDRVDYPGYRDEVAIRATALKASKVLGLFNESSNETQ